MMYGPRWIVCEYVLESCIVIVNAFLGTAGRWPGVHCQNEKWGTSTHLHDQRLAVKITRLVV